MPTVFAPAARALFEVILLQARRDLLQAVGLDADDLLEDVKHGRRNDLQHAAHKLDKLAYSLAATKAGRMTVGGERHPTDTSLPVAATCTRVVLGDALDVLALRLADADQRQIQNRRELEEHGAQLDHRAWVAARPRPASQQPFDRRQHMPRALPGAAPPLRTHRLMSAWKMPT